MSKLSRKNRHLLRRCAGYIVVGASSSAIDMTALHDELEHRRDDVLNYLADQVECQSSDRLTLCTVNSACFEAIEEDALYLATCRSDSLEPPLKLLTIYIVGPYSNGFWRWNPDKPWHQEDYTEWSQNH